MQPAPVDLNKLKNILGNAKKLMAKVEEKSPTKKFSRQINEDLGEALHQSPIYDERDEREPEYGTPNLSSYEPTTPKGYTNEQVMASNLPDVVKQAMINKPIPQLTMPPSKFTLEDLGSLVEKPKNYVKNTTTNLRESVSSDMITISQTKLDNMIKEGINNYFKDNYEKRITEDAIKKTINVLIKEGKINTKK